MFRWLNPPPRPKSDEEIDFPSYVPEVPFAFYTKQVGKKKLSRKSKKDRVLEMGLLLSNRLRNEWYKETELNMKPQTRKPTYLQLDANTKEGLTKIAKYRHSTMANLIEEGVRMVIHRESMRIREDLSDLHEVNQMVRHWCLSSMNIGVWRQRRNWP